MNVCEFKRRSGDDDYAIKTEDGPQC